MNNEGYERASIINFGSSVFQKQIQLKIFTTMRNTGGERTCKTNNCSLM